MSAMPRGYASFIPMACCAAASGLMPRLQPCVLICGQLGPAALFGDLLRVVAKACELEPIATVSFKADGTSYISQIRNSLCARVLHPGHELSFGIGYGATRIFMACGNAGSETPRKNWGKYDEEAFVMYCCFRCLGHRRARFRS
jgi:hypothetical protein